MSKTEAKRKEIIHKPNATENSKFENRPPYFSKIKYNLRIGYLIGVTPIRDIFSVDNAHELRNQIISFAYLYSFLLLIYKTRVTTQLWDILLELSYQYSEQRILSFTDLIAYTMGFVVTYCFGIVAHIMNIMNLSKYLTVLKALDTFEKEFPPLVRKELIGRLNVWLLVKFCLGIFSSGILVCTPAYLAYKCTIENETDFSVDIIPGVLAISDRVGIFVYLLSGFIIREFGVTFLYFEIFSLATCLQANLESIIELIAEKTEHGNKNSWSWSGIARRYYALIEVSEYFQSFAAPYFVILYSTLIASAVSLLYIRANPELLMMRDSNVPMTEMVLWVIFVRIMALAECGEGWQGKRNELLKTVMKASVAEAEIQVKDDDSEVLQLKGLIKSMTMGKMCFRAGGFFPVSRRNVTSITSVILTYVIVLLQFRGSDRNGNDRVNWATYFKEN